MGECTKKIYEIKEKYRKKVCEIRERYRYLEIEELWAHQEELIEKLKQFFIESKCTYLKMEECIVYITYIEYKNSKVVDEKGNNLLWSDYEDVAALVDYLTEQKIL